MDNQDRDALENALLALDTSIRTMVMAKTIIEDRLEAHRGGESQPDPMATMGQMPDLPNCEHLNSQERHTMGQVWYLCADCNEVIQPDEAQT